MKIYSQTLDLRNPLKQRFYVAPYSMFKLGVKVVLDGESAEGSFKLLKGAEEIQADQDLTGGFTTYSLTSSTPGIVEYKVEYKADEEAESQYFCIIQETTGSTVFEVGGEGGSTPEGNFVKSVNGEYPVNSNVDVKKVMIEGEDAWLTGDTIKQSLDNIDEELAKKIEESDIIPVSPATTADDKALAGAKATANFVNSSINALAAFYITKDQQGTQFQTLQELYDGPWYNAGVERQPTQNDYAIVAADEEHENATTRYIWQGSVEEGFWEYQYTINRTPLTQAQLDALNSGITSQIVQDTARKSQLEANVMTLAGEYEDGEAFSFTVYVKNS